MAQPQIVWLRRDLRLADQPAFAAAAAQGPVIPVYVLDDDTPKHRRMGGASRWWLHRSLQSLARDLARHNSRLILRRGDVVDVLEALARETGATTIHALRHVEPWWRKAERALSARLELCLYDGLYLLPPGSLTTGGGTPYKIFTPFKNALFERLDGVDLLPEPALSSPETWPASDTLADWNLQPSNPDWARGFAEAWTPGSDAALARMEEFKDDLGPYRQDREMPSIDGTSRLSPHLHFGEIGPRQLWHATDGMTGSGPGFFRAELAWRDYAAGLVLQFPDYGTRSYRDGYDANETGGLWRNPETDEHAAADLKAWQQGRTGYPIVDAGMRQLWDSGWMHNRVRMIAASFLVKHLLIDWRHGERWFWDTLVDADYPSNATNWQWVSGTGVDSNMFVRIMAPLSQSEKFDAGGYIRDWVPELRGLDDPYVHDPASYGCRPKDYPTPLIGHREGRERALESYREMKA